MALEKDVAEAMFSKMMAIAFAVNTTCKFIKTPLWESHNVTTMLKYRKPNQSPAQLLDLKSLHLSSLQYHKKCHMMPIQNMSLKTVNVHRLFGFQGELSSTKMNLFKPIFEYLFKKNL